jgi:hypothetical protein
MKRNSERGSAMLVAMILMAALLAGATVLVSLQLSSNRSTELTKTGITALYCAEAGLTATRATIAVNQQNWAGALLTPGVQPSWVAHPTINHDLDGDGDSDYEVTLEDNHDEIPPTGDNQLADTDGRIYIVSKCTAYPDTPREVRELITFTELKHCYGSQRGGCGGNGNMNSQ